MKNAKILLVDDEPQNLLLLKAMLLTFGHEPFEAESGSQAMALLDASFDLVLCDVMMPDMDGFELVQAIRSRPDTGHLPVIMVTALSEKAFRLQAVAAGANDFITKPVDKLELQVRTNSLLRQKAQQDELRMYQSGLENMVEARTLELQAALEDLDKAHVDTIHHLAAAAEYKDDETGEHIQRMSAYSALIARCLGLDAAEVERIRICTPMHDIGKIGIPDRVLLKPGRLTPEEWRIMKTHTVIGAEILTKGSSPYMKMGAVIALSHHEKWDGSGYPGGLSGERIPLPGRICAIADVFDALTSKRPYKEAFSVEKSLAIMAEGRGSHFDPEIWDVFMENLDKILEIKAFFQ